MNHQYFLYFNKKKLDWKDWVTTGMSYTMLQGMTLTGKYRVFHDFRA